MVCRTLVDLADQIGRGDPRRDKGLFTSTRGLTPKGNAGGVRERSKLCYTTRPLCVDASGEGRGLRGLR